MILAVNKDTLLGANYDSVSYTLTSNFHNKEKIKIIEKCTGGELAQENGRGGNAGRMQPQ